MFRPRLPPDLDLTGLWDALLAAAAAAGLGAGVGTLAPPAAWLRNSILARTTVRQWLQWRQWRRWRLRVGVAREEGSAW